MRICETVDLPSVKLAVWICSASPLDFHDAPCCEIGFGAWPGHAGCCCPSCRLSRLLLSPILSNRRSSFASFLVLTLDRMTSTVVLSLYRRRLFSCIPCANCYLLLHLVSLHSVSGTHTQTKTIHVVFPPPRCFDRHLLNLVMSKLWLDSNASLVVVTCCGARTCRRFVRCEFSPRPASPHDRGGKLRGQQHKFNSLQSHPLLVLIRTLSNRRAAKASTETTVAQLLCCRQRMPSPVSRARMGKSALDHSKAHMPRSRAAIVSSFSPHYFS